MMHKTFNNHSKMFETENMIVPRFRNEFEGLFENQSIVDRIRLEQRFNSNR